MNLRGTVNARGVVVFFLQLVIAAFGVVGALAPAASQPGVYALSVALASQLAWTMVSWRWLGRRLFDPYVLFFTSAVLFNAGHPLLYVVGATSKGILGGEFPDAILKSTLLLAFAGLAGLHLGAVAVLLLAQKPAPREQATANPTRLRWVGWVSLAVATPAAIIWLSQGVAVVSASGYASLYDRDYSTGLSATPLLLTNLLVTGALFLTAGGRRRPFEARLAGTLIVAFVLVQFYLGYRSTAAMPLMAWAWLRHRAVRPIKTSLLCGAAAVLFLVVFPLVRETRNMSSFERSFDSVTSSFVSLDNPAVTSIDEMGQSMATVAHTVAMVPGERPFDRGTGYLYAALTVFPNLFWDIHPTIARGTNSDWLATAINPWNSRGSAYGYSPIAEAYLNFGVLGTPLVMCLFGALLVQLVLWAESTNDSARLALVAVILAFTLRFPRDELAGVLRPVVWYGLLPYLAAVVGPVMARSAFRTRGVRTAQPVRLSAS